MTPTLPDNWPPTKLPTFSTALRNDDIKQPKTKKISHTIDKIISLDPVPLARSPKFYFKGNEWNQK